MKVLKNTTASVINIADTGVAIPANGTYTIPPQDYPLWAASTNYISYVNSGDLVVNDGVLDLKPSNGISLDRAIDFLEHPDTAFNIRFLSEPERTNGFTSKNIQEAIEEAKAAATSKARYAVSAGFDGNATVGRYLEFNANVDSNISGFIAARAAHIREISAVCTANSTITFQILKKDLTVLTSISLSAARKNTVTGLNIALAANDELLVYVSSGSCARPIVWMFIEPD